ncbi:OmpA family protein (plasmid) [Telmatobacter bradus]|uniref:OmpA family protein n=1 Tax=Telmatobacter bradus TaxID=474953 RepID=UPI003B435D2B
MVGLLAISLSLAAQVPTTAKAADAASASKWDILAGFSYLSPSGHLINTTSNSSTVTDHARAVNLGAVGSVTRYFNPYVGLQAEGDYHNDNDENVVHNDFSGGSLGLVGRYPLENVTFFAHGLVGGENMGSYYTPNHWGVALTVGGGMDYPTPLLNHHLTVRLFQADYQYAHVDSFPTNRGNFNMARLSTGLVYQMGSFATPAALTLGCTASPTVVYPGDVVNLTATVGAVSAKDHVVYVWSGNGIAGSGNNIRVETVNLAPGAYKVRCDAKSGKPGKEGLKPWQIASSMTSFTVKAFEPPTLTCQVTPETIRQDGTATVNCTGISPQNRPLRYSYSATNGTIRGNGTVATFKAEGSSEGMAKIACMVADDMGNSATHNLAVTVERPLPPPATPEQVRLEARLALHSIFFPTGRPAVNDATGGLVASQQTTLRMLAKDFHRYLEIVPAGRLTLTGHADVRGSVTYNQQLSERRVAGAKQFLVEHGVPAAKIDTRAEGAEVQLTSAQVKQLVEKNPELSVTEQQRVLGQLNTIVLAQNRRVDVTLNNTGQQSVKLYPFSVSDSLTLLNAKGATSPTKRTHAHTTKKRR